MAMADGASYRRRGGRARRPTRGRRSCRYLTGAPPSPSLSCQASMGEKSGELLQGTLPLLILRTLAPGPNHGFAIAKRIGQISNAVLKVEQGSLYPALHRM